MYTKFDKNHNFKTYPMLLDFIYNIDTKKMKIKKN